MELGRLEADSIQASAHGNHVCAGFRVPCPFQTLPAPSGDVHVRLPETDRAPRLAEFRGCHTSSPVRFRKERCLGHIPRVENPKFQFGR